jgi:hypothetical protein
METNEKIYSLKEMQDIFCDYAFNRLPDDEKRIFEFSLPHYPEIREELEGVRSVFGKVEAMDLDKKYSGFTRNMSVKVNKRISNENKGFYNKYATKYIVPAAGLVFILILILYRPFSNYTSNNNHSQSHEENFIGITNAEVASVLKDSLKNIDMIGLSKDLSIGLGDDDIDRLAALNPGLLDESYDVLFEDVMKDFDLTKTKSLADIKGVNQYNIYDQLENLKEDDIQNILKELENEDFNS